MKETEGRANPKLVNELLREKLNGAELVVNDDLRAER